MYLSFCLFTIYLCSLPHLHLQIINKGLVLKDNFEGGATWAFEVGSQSMICPIIVEDLNPPRQLLVEVKELICSKTIRFIMNFRMIKC